MSAGSGSTWKVPPTPRGLGVGDALLTPAPRAPQRGPLDGRGSAAAPLPLGSGVGDAGLTPARPTT
jgi:hypothetical protein